MLKRNSLKKNLKLNWLRSRNNWKPKWQHLMRQQLEPISPNNCLILNNSLCNKSMILYWLLIRVSLQKMMNSLKNHQHHKLKWKNFGPISRQNWMSSNNNWWSKLMRQWNCIKKDKTKSHLFLSQMSRPNCLIFRRTFHQSWINLRTSSISK